jgi:hypothetical protein
LLVAARLASNASASSGIFPALMDRGERAGTARSN